MTRYSGEEERPQPNRRSTELGRSSIDQGSIARDVDLGQRSLWWTQENTLPPSFQNKPDIFYEIEESQTKQRGGKTTVSKDVYLLFHDYSQTVISARFDPRAPEDVIFEQRHEPSPHQLRQDQLEEYWDRFGSKIAESLSSKQNATVGDGTPQALVTELLATLKGALAPVGSRAFGALVYAMVRYSYLTKFDREILSVFEMQNFKGNMEA